MSYLIPRSREHPFWFSGLKNNWTLKTRQSFLMHRYIQRRDRTLLDLSQWKPSQRICLMRIELLMIRFCRPGSDHAWYHHWHQSGHSRPQDPLQSPERVAHQHGTLCPTMQMVLSLTLPKGIATLNCMKWCAKRLLDIATVQLAFAVRLGASDIKPIWSTQKSVLMSLMYSLVQYCFNSACMEIVASECSCEKRSSWFSVIHIFW